MSASIRSFLVTLALTLPILSQQPSNYDVLQTASQHIASHDFSTAQRELQTLLENDPTEHRAENLLGVIFAEQGNDEKAEIQFRRALADPSLAGARINLALLLEKRHDLTRAADLLEQGYRIDPTRQDAVLGLTRVLRNDAQLALKQGTNERALADLLRARKFAPSDPDLLYEFGITCLRQSLYADAEPALQRAIELRPNFSAAYYALGRAQIGTQHFPEAEKSMLRYNDLQPNDPTALYGLGLVASLQQRTAEARDFFQRSIKLQPAQTESWYELGSLDLQANDPSHAEEKFRRVLARNPKHAPALLGLAQALFQKHDYAAAKTSLDAAIEAQPKLSKAHYYLGLTLSRLGNKEESAHEIQLADRLQHEEIEQNRVQLRLADPKS